MKTRPIYAYYQFMGTGAVKIIVTENKPPDGDDALIHLGATNVEIQTDLPLHIVRPKKEDR